MEWQKLSDDALRLYLAFKELTTTNKTPLTLESVCDTYGIPRTQALPCLKELEDNGFLKKGQGTVRLAEDSRLIHFKKSSPSRVEELERDVIELKRLLKTRVLGERSGIADKLPPEEKLFVTELERDMGRGLDVNEAYLLGKCINGWGIPRTKALLRQKRDADNPFVVVYSMLSNNARGKKFEQKQERKITYRERQPNES